VSWLTSFYRSGRACHAFAIRRSAGSRGRQGILGETADKLAAFVDIPWCRADEYYVQKLALTLNAAATAKWEQIR
jgi:hypothetical protein